MIETLENFPSPQLKILVERWATVSKKMMDEGKIDDSLPLFSLISIMVETVLSQDLADYEVKAMVYTMAETIKAGIKECLPEEISTVKGFKRTETEKVILAFNKILEKETTPIKAAS